MAHNLDSNEVQTVQQSEGKNTTRYLQQRLEHHIGNQPRACGTIHEQSGQAVAAGSLEEHGKSGDGRRDRHADQYIFRHEGPLCINLSPDLCIFFLAQPNGLRGNLHQLVIINVRYAVLQAHVNGGREDNRLVRP